MNADQKRRVLKVLKRVMQEEKAAGYFNDPVDAEGLGIPEYRDIVKNPMDLTQVLTRVEEGFYTSVMGVLEDVLLVWSNCRLFNEPGSDVCTACDEVASLFEKQWRQSGLEKWAKPGDESLGIRSDGSRAPEPTRPQSSPKMPAQRAGPPGEARPAPKAKAKAKRPPEFPLEDLRNGHPLERCLKALVFTCSHPQAQAAAFNRTLAERGKPNLQQVQALLEPGRAKGWGTVNYKSTTEVLEDVRRVWSACRGCFPPNHDMQHLCNTLRQAFEFAWGKAGLISEQQPAGSEQGPMQERSHKRKAVAPPLRDRESSPPARQPPPRLGGAASQAGPLRVGQRGSSGPSRLRLPTPPLEDLSELVNFDDPDEGYEELAQGPRKRPASSGPRPSSTVPHGAAESSRDVTGSSQLFRAEQPPPRPRMEALAAVIKAAEIQPHERKVLAEYAQLQATRTQAYQAMEVAKEAVARLRRAQAELLAANAAASRLVPPKKPPPEIWPPDAPLVSSTAVAQAPKKPMELPADVMALGKALFSSYSTQAPAADFLAGPGQARAGQTDRREPASVIGTPAVQLEHIGDQAAGDGHTSMTAWQRRLQSSVPYELLQKAYQDAQVALPAVIGRSAVGVSNSH